MRPKLTNASLPFAGTGHGGAHAPPRFRSIFNSANADPEERAGCINIKEANCTEDENCTQAFQGMA